MKKTQIKLVVLVLAVLALAAASPNAEPSKSDTEVIRFGMSLSELILSGTFDGTAMGGGGATSTVIVNEVLKAPKRFQTPKTITVYWLSDKDPGAARYTNSFLFFLRRSGANTETGYSDVTGNASPFVQASDNNVRFLRSQLIATGETDKSTSDEIRESVFRKEIASFSLSLQFKDGIFFLSIGQGGSDPNDDFMRRLRDFGSKVKKQSMAKREIAGVKDRETGHPGIILYANDIKFISDTEAEIEGGYYINGKGAGGSTFTVKLEKDKWVVTKEVLLWIS